MSLKDKEAKRVYDARYYALHQEANRVASRAWKMQHPEQVRLQQQKWYRDNYEYAKQRGKQRRALWWDIALKMLGDKCTCPGCDEKRSAFLTIDHIKPKNRTEKQRRNALQEAYLSGWDKSLFQILCFNCNCAKGNTGVCPVHEGDEKQERARRIGDMVIAEKELPLFALTRTS